MLIFATMINDVDDRAFMQEVYQQNERLMYAIALKYASNTQDCEDIVHDTVERLCKNIRHILPSQILTRIFLLTFVHPSTYRVK